MIQASDPYSVALYGLSQAALQAKFLTSIPVAQQAGVDVTNMFPFLNYAGWPFVASPGVDYMGGLLIHRTTCQDANYRWRIRYSREIFITTLTEFADAPTFNIGVMRLWLLIVESMYRENNPNWATHRSTYMVRVTIP